MKPAWAPDGLTLSARTTKGGKDITRQVAKEIAAAIRKGETVEKAALSLSDGYGYGHVLPAQDIPAFMQQLAAIGKRREYKGRAFRQALRTIERQLERVNTQGLKSAYHALKDAIEAGNKKSIRKAIYVATQERTRYFARRIARTEMARAYGDGVMAKWADDDDCVAFQWRTSSAHPFGDICDLYGKADLYGMGKGIYPKDKVPRLPVHPNCMCHLRPVMAGSNLIKGKEKDNIEQGGMDYIQGLNLHQQERLLGESGRKEVLRKGNWRSKARGYSGEMMHSRVESGTERGISNKREIGDPIMRIDREYIRSKAFADKFTRLENPETVNRQLRICARKALFRNDGKPSEDIFFIHESTGELLAKIVRYDYAKGARYTEEIRRILSENKGKVITLHSHPNNNPPTGSDLLSALRHAHKKGYVVTVSGDVHEYEIISTNAEYYRYFGAKVARIKGNNYTVSTKQAITSILRLGVKMGVLKWREIK